MISISAFYQLSNLAILPAEAILGPAGRARSVRPAGPKIAFMFSVFVCVCVCVYVCVFVRKYHVRSIVTSFHYYVTIATSAVEAIESLQAQ